MSKKVFKTGAKADKKQAPKEEKKPAAPQKAKKSGGCKNCP